MDVDDERLPGDPANTDFSRVNTSDTFRSAIIIASDYDITETVLAAMSWVCAKMGRTGVGGLCARGDGIVDCRPTCGRGRALAKNLEWRRYYLTSLPDSFKWDVSMELAESARCRWTRALDRPAIYCDCAPLFPIAKSLASRTLDRQSRFSRARFRGT